MGRHKKGLPVCIICKKDLKPEDLKRLIAIEKPIRLNLMAHRDCLDIVGEKKLKAIIVRYIEENRL